LPKEKKQLKSGTLKITPFLFLLLPLWFSCKKEVPKVYTGTAKEIEQQLMADNHINLQKTYEFYINGDQPDTTHPYLVELKEFDKKGSMLRHEVYNKNPDNKSQDAKYISTYNEEGQEITMDMMDENGMLTRHNEYTYENGYKVLSKVFGPNKEPIGTVIYKCDKKGNCLEMISQDIDTGLCYKETYFYNEKGEETAFKTYNYWGILEGEQKVLKRTDNYLEYEYFRYITYQFHNLVKTTNNDRKQPIKMEYITDIKLNTGYRFEYTYNKKGLLVETKEYEIPSGKLMNFQRVSYVKF
jgi:hypothetical protein